MSDDRSPPGNAVPGPGRPADTEGTDEAKGELGSRSASRPPDRPASVRDTMRSARRYDPGSGRRPLARRRNRGRERSAPPPARELTNPLAVEVPTRRIELEDGVWTVVVKGSGTVGSEIGRSARLLSVGFEAPGERANPEGTRYLAAGRLEEVDEEVLRGLVAEVDSGAHATPASSRRRKS